MPIYCRLVCDDRLQLGCAAPSFPDRSFTGAPPKSSPRISHPHDSRSRAPSAPPSGWGLISHIEETHHTAAAAVAAVGSAFPTPFGSFTRLRDQPSCSDLLCSPPTTAINHLNQLRREADRRLASKQKNYISVTKI